MISTTILSIACLLGTEATTASTWHTTYKDAINEAKRADKPLFILFNAGSSSAVRLVGEIPVLSDEIEQTLEAGYERMYVDTETEAGSALAEEFGASQSPMIAVVGRGGEQPSYRSTGTPTTNQLLSVLWRYSARPPANRPLANSQTRLSSSLPVQTPSDAATSSKTEGRSYSTPVSSGGSSARWCRT